MAAMTSEQPRRHWFRPRYSLATLFVVVTAISCWLGYQLHWVNQRRQLLADQHVIYSVEPWVVALTDVPPSAPGLLWLMGETGVNTIGIYAEGHEFDQLTEAERHRIDQILSLFPESRAVLVIDATGKGHWVRGDRPNR